MPINFQAIFESMPGNFIILQPNIPDYTILAISDELVSITGREKQNIIGKKLFEVFPDNPKATAPGPSTLAISLQNALEHKRMDHMPVVRYDVTNLTGEFQERHWAASNKPVLNPQGDVLYLIHTTAEITEQVLNRLKIVESETRFRNMIEQAPVAIALTRGADVVIESINAPMLRVMSKENEAEVLGKKLVEVLPEVTNQAILSIILQVFESGEAFRGNEIPVNFRVAEKLEERYFNLSYTPVLEAGKIIGVLHLAIDVTEQVQARRKIEQYTEELRESEQRFRLMADASPALIWSLEPDASLKYANKFMLEFLGITLEKLKTDNWVPYIHPEDLPRSIHTIGEALEKGQPFRNEHRFLRQDGEHRWLLSQAAPSYYPNGELYGYVGSSVDITEIKQAEIALQRSTQELAGVNEELRFSSYQVQETNDQLSSSNQQLSRINADMDNFIYSASHDLKTPISNIEGLMHAILEDLPREVSQEPDMRELFQRVNASIERFKKTISDLAEITKLNREDASEKDSQVDLALVIKEVLLDLRAPMEQAQAKLEMDLANCASVHLSAKNVRSIIYNLISNAVKYRSSARPSFIQIRCYRQELYQVLSVRDNGLGMDLSDESKVFGMFKRLHDHVEGSGVGLYMVKKIIENAGGKIQVESQVDQGTTFRVYFPRNQD